MRTELFTYDVDGTIFEASAAFPERKDAPIVIVCHAWNGRDGFIQETIEMIAQLGWIGFALDVYGKGVLGRSKEENIRLKTPLLQDRQLLKRRLMAGLEIARGLSSSNISALGFGFGGLCALDIARSVPDIRGVVSIYGHFEEGRDLLNRNIRGSVLLLHGANDPVVTPNELLAFGNDLTRHNIDWQAHVFGITMHAFMNPIAKDPTNGVLYNQSSAKRAWDLARRFLSDCFAA